MLGRPKRVEKAWGREDWVHNSPMYCGKLLVIQPGGFSSYHYHELKHETWLVLEGQVTIQLDGATHLMDAGSTLELPPYTRHQFASHGGATIMEVSTQHVETDSVRLSSSGRRDGQA